MIRVVDTRYLNKPWTIPGKFWADKLAPNGTVWRTQSAIKHAWSMNGSYVSMPVPTLEEMEKLGIAIPAGWDGMRLWKGAIAEQVDIDKEVGTMRLLVGGDLQYFVDFSHSHNAPVKEWIDRQLAAGLLKPRKTNWNDVTLPGEAEAHALMLEERERSKSPTGSIPLRMAWIMVALTERLWKTLSRSGEPPITRQLLRLIGKDFTLDTTKAQGQLGYRPEVSWVEGIEAMKIRHARERV